MATSTTDTQDTLNTWHSTADTYQLEQPGNDGEEQTGEHVAHGTGALRDQGDGDENSL